MHNTQHFCRGTFWNRHKVVVELLFLCCFFFRNKFFVHYRSQDREQRMITEGRQEKMVCSGKTMETVTGMKMCAQASLPVWKGADSAWFPLTGPSTVSVTVENMDTFRTYNVDYRMTRERVSIWPHDLLTIRTIFWTLFIYIFWIRCQYLLYFNQSKNHVIVYLDPF